MIDITLFTSKTKLNKNYWLDKQGKKQKNSNAQMYSGKAKTVSVDSMSDFNEFLEGLKSNQAIGLGTLEQGYIAQITTSSNLNLGLDGYVTRSKQFFNFKPQATLALIDIDNAEFTLKEAHDYLIRLVPQLAQTSMLLRHSSSSNVFRTDYSDYSEKAKIHVYILINDGLAITDLKDRLNFAGWIDGKGHIELSSSGALLERNFFDMAVFSPERLIFESKPVVGDGLMYLKMDSIIQEGIPLDATTLVLNDHERITLSGLISEAKHSLKPQSEILKHEFKKEVKTKFTDKAQNVTDNELENLIENNLLPDSLLLHSKQHGFVSVRDVALNPSKFENDNFSDPLQPESTEFRAKLYINEVNIVIHSFRHGGIKYVIPDQFSETYAALLKAFFNKEKFIVIDDKKIKVQLSYEAFLGQKIEYSPRHFLKENTTTFLEYVTNRHVTNEADLNYFLNLTISHYSKRSEISEEFRKLLQNTAKNIYLSNFNRVLRDNSVEQDIIDKHNLTVFNCTGKTPDYLATYIDGMNKSLPKLRVFDTRGMGSCKTILQSKIAEIWKKEKYSFNYLTHRISLIVSSAELMNIESYEETNPYSYKGNKLLESLAICINSFTKFADDRVKHLLLDESRQVWETILGADTIEERLALFTAFKQAVNLADVVIFSDAQMSSDFVDWIMTNSPEDAMGVFLTQDFQETKIKYSLLPSHSAGKQRVLDLLNDDKCVSVPCTSEKQLSQVKKHLTEQGIVEESILCVSGSNYEPKFLKNPIEYLEKNQQIKCVIYTSTLGSGFSIVCNRFKNCVFLNSQVLPANESWQIIMRFRCLENVEISFDTTSNEKKIESADDIIQAHRMSIADFFELEEIERLCPNELMNLRVNHLAKINVDFNNFEREFKLLGAVQGIELVKDCDVEDIALVGLAKRTQDEINNEILEASQISYDTYQDNGKYSSLHRAEKLSQIRYEVFEMTGLDSQSELTIEDIEAFNDNMLQKIRLVELLEIDDAILLDRDKTDIANVDRLGSRVGKKRLLNKLLGALNSNKGIVTKIECKKACDIIYRNKEWFHLLGLGNFKNKVSVTGATIRIQKLLPKLGLCLVIDKHTENGHSYRIEKDLKVMRYVEQRRLKRELPQQKKDAFTVKLQMLMGNEIGESQRPVLKRPPKVKASVSQNAENFEIGNSTGG